MKIQDYSARIRLFHEANPDLGHEDLAVLLTADLLYEDLPEDLPEFRKRFAHLDPRLLEQPSEGITFLKIAQSDEPLDRIRERLNAYLNIKFHDIVHSKHYAENATVFARHSRIASRVIEELLEKSALPSPLVDMLREQEEVASCHDFLQMTILFRESRDRRLRYELLRKLGLIVLIARINRSVEVDELATRVREVWEGLRRGLGANGTTDLLFHLWLTAKGRVAYETDPERADAAYRRAREERIRRALRVYPLQRFRCRPFRTRGGNEIVHMEIRNKFGNGQELSYTSFVEKMVRKNLEFPNQVHDTVGVKIVVNAEAEIPRIISDLESFLGGSSTRKMEKNSYHRFGRRQLGPYSSKDYFVWKAIYDMTLPHPSIPQLEKMLELTQGNAAAQEELRTRLAHFVNNPRDFVIEVQLQDIRSYLLSIAEGSPTAHGWLKMNQIRANSFYKIFPREVYEEAVAGLKDRLLHP